MIDQLSVYFNSTIYQADVFQKESELEGGKKEEGEMDVRRREDGNDS
jgi:hypothetical protein